MKFTELLVFLLCVLQAGVSAKADSLADIRNESHKISIDDRINRLEALQDSSPRADRPVIELLITDAKYEKEKRHIARQMFTLAIHRIQGMPSGDTGAFAREAAQYDALSIIQAIPFSWLSTEDQEQALALVKQIDAELGSPKENQISPPLNETASAEPGSIDDAISIVNAALERARREDLSLIADAQPNGVLNDALEKCETAREMVMAHAPDSSGTSRSRWEAAMVHLGKAVTILKERQRLKYALWAEGRYRETDPMTATGKMEQRRAIELYRRLSEVNVSLVAEPSLSREITKRLYELYDSIDSPKSKERVRYDAIISLEARKTLDDF